MEPISKALSLKTELDTLRPLDPEQGDRIMQKFRLDWNYHSNHLEGNSLSFGETKALILFGITAQGKPLKDHLEIEGHNQAIEWVLDIVDGEYPLTETFIRELHTLLLKESYSVKAITPEGQPTTKRVEIGKYKSQPNHVLTATGEMFYFATPEETPAKMEELLNWYREKSISENVNPVFLAAEFHYRFIRIHPFDDGNGRTARILMNFILLKFGFPPVIIKTEDKQNYFSVLRLADAGQIEPFVNYIAENLIRSLELMIRGAKGEDIEEPDDFGKELALLEKRLNATKVVERNEKTLEAVQDVFNKSIWPLFLKVKSSSQKFSHFYERDIISYSINDYVPQIIDLDEPTLLSGISSETSKIAIVANFNSFKFPKVGAFDFGYGFIIFFQDTKYLVTRATSYDLLLEKEYHEYLSEEEIEQIINFELKRHMKFIEERTDDYFSNKS